MIINAKQSTVRHNKQHINQLSTKYHTHKACSRQQTADSRHHASAQGLGSVWRHVMARQACPSTSGRRSPSAASMRGASWRSSRAGTPGARRCDDAAPGLSDGRFGHIRPANSAARRATGVAFQLENSVIRCLGVETLAVVCGPGYCSHCPSTPR